MKLLQVWNDMGVSEKLQHFHFGVEYPFKYSYKNKTKKKEKIHKYKSLKGVIWRC